MGFNATRKYRDGKGVDLAILVAGILVVVLLVAWGAGAIG